MKLSLMIAAATALAYAHAFSTQSSNVAAFTRSTTPLFAMSGRVATQQDYQTLATEDEVRSLFKLWNDALATGDSRIVAARYAPDAVLLPTVSDTPRTNPDAIKDYFDSFLLKKPQGEIITSFVKTGSNWAQDNGIYEFTMGVDGSKVKARYTYFYVKGEDSKWKILHHHSSIMPERIDIAQPITENEVRSLFYLWNDALATLDPNVVASRYSSDAVLLPTVSDVPRDTREKITDYFVNFLKNQPQGEILESFVQIGTNWCKDSGIYEFTMGATGAKVKARYSFVYVYEDGQWKIAHHHSSQMPEALQAKQPVLSDQEVRDLFGLWNDALATLDPSQVAERYSRDAILLPTVSDEPRTSEERITEYFVNFLKNKPQGVITQGMVRSGPGWAKDAGVYRFTMGATGDEVLARYTFVYVYEDGQWKIAHHHSSVMPEGLLAGANSGDVLESHEVRGLFNLWNDALATENPNIVADRYAKDAILLPTVSDEPRTTKEGITDYFVKFLQNKPQGVITDGVTISGPGWCEDAGVYEFTMGADGSRVMARYSFVYVQEDGEWKIAHHHSSAMPEGLLAASAKIKQLESLFERS